ncbi:hypothetical protein KVT40_001847 [Elsinoe batatas]|uniref:Uncharacterized protein n=1 Tax=Elsinoe batatas TaxID=2601811 RepID=A0A8K0L8T6_9PEZI|nr:hypothetical protein KVT40_001847 [Elsinoe batatas]
MEGSQAFQSCHFAVPSPCGTYIASLTQQNLYVQYADSLSPAFTFPLDDPSQPKIVAENQSLQWSPQSTFLMLVSTQGVHAYSLLDSSVNIHVSNGSGSLGKIHAAEVLADSGREQLMVIWEFGRVNLWDLSIGRATEIGDLKMGGKSSPWALRRQKGRPEVLVLLMRRDSQDVLSFYLPPSLVPFRSITLPTVDAQAISWSTCGRWLSVLDSPLNSQPVLIFTPDGFLFRQYPSLPTPPSTPGGEGAPSLGFKSASWSSDHLVLSSASDLTLLSSRAFLPSKSLPLSSIHTSQRSLEDSIVAYQETINAAGQRSYDTLTGQLIPLPNAKTSLIDVRANSSGAHLSCRDEGNDTAVYIISTSPQQIHSLLILHSPIRRATWHPTRPNLLLILTETGTLHIWDITSSQPPIHIPHSFEALPAQEKGRVEARWVSPPFPHSTSPTVASDTASSLNPSDDATTTTTITHVPPPVLGSRAGVEGPKLSILLTTRKAGFQLLWPEGRPSPILEGLRNSVAIARGDAVTPGGDESEDSLYDILTGRTPLPALKVRGAVGKVQREAQREVGREVGSETDRKVREVEREVEMEEMGETGGLEDTFRGKIAPGLDDRGPSGKGREEGPAVKAVEQGMKGCSLEDDSEIF